VALNGLTLQTEHGRDAWTVDIHIEQADLIAGQSHGRGQIDRHRAFAHPTLAGEDDDLVFDAAEAFLNLLPLGKFLIPFVGFSLQG